MKTGYKIQHDDYISPEDTVMEVLNYDFKNSIVFYTWLNRNEFKITQDTIGMWKIKSLKN